MTVPTFFRRLKTLTQPKGIHAHIVFTDEIVYREKGEEIDYFVPGDTTRLPSVGNEAVDLRAHSG